MPLPIYDALTEEIRINARTPTLRDRYRTTFSLELFGRENYFPETNKYTLDPIRRDGPASVQCIDVPGLVWVRLVKLEYELPDLEKEVRSHKAADVFNALACRQFVLPPQARLLQATFKVRFRDNPIPRSVTIKPKNVALTRTSNFSGRKRTEAALPSSATADSRRYLVAVADEEPGLVVAGVGEDASTRGTTTAN